MSKLTNFVDSHLGKCTADGDPFGCQCVALIYAWCDELGIARLTGNAVDLDAQANPDTIWVPVGSGLPKPGDIIVWGPTSEIGIGKNGHTDIVVDNVTQSGFHGLDQNWFNSGPQGSAAAYVDHSYVGVRGWHHIPKLDDKPIQEDNMPNEVPGPHFPKLGPFDATSPVTLFLGVNTGQDRVYIRFRNDNPDPSGATVNGLALLVSDSGPIEGVPFGFSLAPSKAIEWQLPLDEVGDLILQKVDGVVSVSVKFGKL